MRHSLDWTRWGNWYVEGEPIASRLPRLTMRTYSPSAISWNCALTLPGSRTIVLSRAVSDVELPVTRRSRLRSRATRK